MQGLTGSFRYEALVTEPFAFGTDAEEKVSIEKTGERIGEMQGESFILGG